MLQAAHISLKTEGERQDDDMALQGSREVSPESQAATCVVRRRRRWREQSLVTKRCGEGLEATQTASVTACRFSEFIMSVLLCFTFSLTFLLSSRFRAPPPPSLPTPNPHPHCPVTDSCSPFILGVKNKEFYERCLVAALPLPVCWSVLMMQMLFRLMSRSYVSAEVYHPALPSCLMNKNPRVRVQTGAPLRSQDNDQYTDGASSNKRKAEKDSCRFVREKQADFCFFWAGIIKMNLNKQHDITFEQ